jgi:UDPglucose 6-dehydrogenase
LYGNAVSFGFSNVLGSSVDIREYDKYKDTESLEDVVFNSDILFVCLPTPMKTSGACDTSIIDSVMLEIAEMTNKRKLVVIKSTIPPGTTEKLQKKYEKFDFVFNPEFLRQKTWAEDFLTQDRIYLGWAKKMSEVSTNYIAINDLYKTFISKQVKPGRIENTKSTSAEMAKYMANCFLATKISFFNEMYNICQAAGIDYKQASKLAAEDNRIGKYGTQVPGEDGQRGFAGGCFPKDVNALTAFAEELDVDPFILQTVWAANLSHREKHDWKDLPQVNGKYDKTKKKK